ncbi:MAG: hypothetical protein PHT84_05220 [Candidatus Pacebacteria bacterium]|nr:hypothetical protein [Candidatus Paceibacterota bacterium]
MIPPSPTASQKRSINLFNAEEEEIDAISFERIGVNTMHYKDRTSIVSAKYADVTTCLGEIRPGKGVKFIPAEVPAIYDSIPEIISPSDPTEWGDVTIKENEMVIFAKIIATPPISVASGDIVGAFYAGDLRGRSVVQNIGGQYLCVIVVYYDTDQIGKTLNLKLYSIDDNKIYSSNTPILIENGVVGSLANPIQLHFNVDGGGSQL